MFIVSYFCYMATLTIEVLNEHALNLLKELEALKFIRIQGEEKESPSNTENLITKYKGAMTTQSIAEIDKQLYDLRKE